MLDSMDWYDRDSENRLHINGFRYGDIAAPFFVGCKQHKQPGTLGSHAVSTRINEEPTFNNMGYILRYSDYSWCVRSDTRGRRTVIKMRPFCHSFGQILTNLSLSIDACAKA